jgi:hypothetical protein
MVLRTKKCHANLETQPLGQGEIPQSEVAKSDLGIASVNITIF